MIGLSTFHHDRHGLNNSNGQLSPVRIRRIELITVSIIHNYHHICSIYICIIDMIRSNTRISSLASSSGLFSPQGSIHDPDISSFDDNSTNSTILLPSSVTLTPRPSVKAKRSLVWRYFRVIDEKSFDVECVLCCSKVPRKSTSTSNMLHHVQTRHENEYQVVNKAMRSKTNDLS